MWYFLLQAFGGWLFLPLLIVVVMVLYIRTSRRIAHLEAQVKTLLAAQETPMAPSAATAMPAQERAAPPPLPDTAASSAVPTKPDTAYPLFISINNVVIHAPLVSTAAFYQTLYADIYLNADSRHRADQHNGSTIRNPNMINNDAPATAHQNPTQRQNARHDTQKTTQRYQSNYIQNHAPMEPDEHSLPIVTSLMQSVKQWFLGGNLVVRVGVLVLLVGVILLLRLLSDYIEIPIHIKLAAVVIAGLGLAGLGLKLAKKRFAYGISLQGTGLSIAYLSTFFAYSVYHVISSLPSFMALGALSALTIFFAVRQNAFPLALLALSGGFFAPILTSEDTGSLTALFSYYLLLNVTIAIIAHYRPWKVLNVLGVTVTFGLAYYWGLTQNLSAIIDTQRWMLVLLTALHVLLYLFVVIRYAQHIISYNTQTDSNDAATRLTADGASVRRPSLQSLHSIFPIDTSLLFSAPILAFGVFAVLLDGIEHGLTVTAGILALLYLGTGYLLAQKSPRYLLVTESMLALGTGFLAIMVALALDADWVSGGWSIQALVLVWLGQRSRRIWPVYFGLALHGLGLCWLWLWDIPHQLTAGNGSLMLIWLLTAWLPLISAFLLRHFSASDKDNHWHQSGATSQPYGLSFIFLLFATGWSVLATYDAFALWWDANEFTLMIAAVVAHSFGYWLVDSKASWRQARRSNRVLLLLFYAFMLTIQPIYIMINGAWQGADWLLFIMSALAALGTALLWLKRWYEAGEQHYVDATSLLITTLSVLLYTLIYSSDAEHVAPAMLLVTLLYGIALYSYWQHISAPESARRQTLISRAPAWMSLPHALIGTGKALLPIALAWVVISNIYSNGNIWQLPYLPVLSILDISMGMVIAVSLLLLLVLKQVRAPNAAFVERYRYVLLILAMVGFWWLSSILVRSLHVFIGTPLWNATVSAWDSDQVQTGLTILWTLIALVATILASRYWQRVLWFMGVGLLGVVVLKLVLIDLSQTDAIWRVVSFIGAGSLILLIGYLAPLPPAEDSADNSTDG